MRSFVKWVTFNLSINTVIPRDVQRLDLEYEEGTFTRVFYMFGRLCTVINSSLNFAVYSVGGQEFKRTLVQVPKQQWLLRIVYNYIVYVSDA
jgi:lysozyme family protein